MDSMTTLRGNLMMPPLRLRLGRVLTASAARLILTWKHRSQTRMALRDLDPRLLRDIGVSAGDAHQEAIKPFWLP